MFLAKCVFILTICNIAPNGLIRPEMLCKEMASPGLNGVRKLQIWTINGSIFWNETATLWNKSWYSFTWGCALTKPHYFLPQYVTQKPAVLWQTGPLPTGSPIFPFVLPSPEYLHPVGAPREGPFSTDSQDVARYSAIIMGGGGESTRGRCYDVDATAVYCSSGPHVWSQMWPENAKNEACFYTLH